MGKGCDTGGNAVWRTPGKAKPPVPLGRAAAAGRLASFVAQRVDGIEAAGAPGGIETEDDADGGGNAG